MDSSYVILGIDPGYDRLGYAIIRGENINSFEVLKLGLISSDSRKQYRDRLKDIYADLESLFKEFSFDIVVVEKLFFWRNVTTAFKVGMVMGLLYLLLGSERYIEVHPVTLKKFLTGHGKATKKDVMLAIKKRFNISINAPDDVWDALGIGLYGLYNK